MAFRLVAPAAHHEHEHLNRTQCSHPCSRSIARAVRLHLKREVLEPSSKAGVDKWSPGCSLSPELDLWGPHEKMKHSKRFRGSQWTCGFCGKKFKSEYYLDLHMEHKHMNETPANGVCLANYCELFNACHEHVVHQQFGHKRKKHEHHHHEHAHPPCNDTVMQQSRHLCEHTLTKCFPLEKKEARELHGEYSRKFCRTLDCRIRAEQELANEQGSHHLIVHLSLMLALFALVAAGMWYCVEHFDHIAGFLTKQRLAPAEVIKSMTKRSEQTREVLGMDRTKGV